MTNSFGDEIFRPAYDDRQYPQLSYGLRLDEACAQHASRLGASKIYVLASRSLATRTDAFKRLKQSLGDNIIGSHISIGAHTPVAECIEVITKVRKLGGTDCLVTLGEGSVTDAGKPIAFAIANETYDADQVDTLWGGHSHNRNE